MDLEQLCFSFSIFITTADIELWDWWMEKGITVKRYFRDRFGSLMGKLLKERDLQWVLAEQQLQGNSINYKGGGSGSSGSQPS